MSIWIVCQQCGASQCEPGKLLQRTSRNKFLGLVCWYEEKLDMACFEKFSCSWLSQYTVFSQKPPPVVCSDIIFYTISQEQDMKFNCLVKSIHTTFSYCCPELLLLATLFIFSSIQNLLKLFLEKDFFFPWWLKSICLTYVHVGFSFYHLLLLSSLGFPALLSSLTFSGCLHIVNTASYCTLGRNK